MTTLSSSPTRSSRVELPDYQDRYQHVKLNRTDDGILTVQLHTQGQALIFALETYQELISAL